MGDLFEGVIGHGPILDLLTADLAVPAHAYLFVGPVGVGKATVARRFSAGLLCDGDPSGARRVANGVHPDLVLIEPDGRTAITVDQARNTVALAGLAPVEGDRKVFVFEEGGAMNDEAANALLKTLEEPSASTVFLIIAESEDDLPMTVASRCRTVGFGRVPDADVAAGLEAAGVDADRALQVARISGGRPGLAISLATQSEVAGFRNVWMSIPLRLSEHPGDAYRLADEVTAATEPLLAAVRHRQEEEMAVLEAGGSGGKAAQQRHERERKRAVLALHVTGLEILAGFYRDVAAAQLGAPVRNSDIPAPALTRVTPRVALHNVDRILEAVESLEANQRVQLALAALFCDLGASQ